MAGSKAYKIGLAGAAHGWETGANAARGTILTCDFWQFSARIAKTTYAKESLVTIGVTPS
jgi:hypothetical protein